MVAAWNEIIPFQVCISTRNNLFVLCIVRHLPKRNSFPIVATCIPVMYRQYSTLQYNVQ
jgi:hypothetical protein